MNTHSVALFTAFYHGLPYPLNEDIYLPEKAANLLTQRTKMTDEQQAYLEKHIVTLGIIMNGVSETPIALSVSSAAQPAQTSPAVYTVTGKTTFQQLMDWGISQETIENIISDKIPSNAMSIKDYAAQKGVEASVYKDALQNEVNKLKK